MIIGGKIKKVMTWCSSPDNKRDDGVHEEEEDQRARERSRSPPPPPPSPPSTLSKSDSLIAIATPPLISIRICPSCGHEIKFKDHQGGRINELPGLPAGVKFDPTDQELLEHLEGKVRSDPHKLHRMIDEFIPTLEGENGICYTHPEKLPGVSKNGQIRHFFHRPSKAYTTGNRKRRKVHTDIDDRTTASASGGNGGETRWHKTGKTRPVFFNGELKGFKKILVLYTNYGKQRKPEKTNWVMHQYHLGGNEEEKDGELVVSKVFYQTQPRQCGNNNPTNAILLKDSSSNSAKNPGLLEFFNSSNFISYDQANNSKNQSRVLPHFSVHRHDGSSLLPN